MIGYIVNGIVMDYERVRGLIVDMKMVGAHWHVTVKVKDIINDKSFDRWMVHVYDDVKILMCNNYEKYGTR